MWCVTFPLLSLFSPLPSQPASPLSKIACLHHQIGLWTTKGVTCTYDSSKSFTELKQSIILVREWKVYLWRIFIPIVLITLCSMSVFGLHPVENFEGRMSLTFTLLLTITSFQFVVQAELPKQPGLTVMGDLTPWLSLKNQNLQLTSFLTVFLAQITTYCRPSFSF